MTTKATKIFLSSYLFILFIFSIPDDALALGTPSASLTRDNIEVQKFIIARDFFSSILNTQTSIFTFIVLLFLTLNWLYQRKVAREDIQKEVKKEVDALVVSIKQDLNTSQKDLTDTINQRLNRGDAEIQLLRGEIYRSMAQFWDSQKSFGTGLIWWVRASFYFFIVGEENMTRISLGAAKNSVENVKYFGDLNTDMMGEIQRLLAQIDDKLYKIEKEMLYESIKLALNKKFPTT